MIRRALLRLKGPALKGGLLLFSFTVAALIAEVAVRLVAPQQLILIRPDVWQPADTVGWLHRPNVRTQINTGERTVTMLTDDQGFRVGEDARPAGGLRVLLLGDSFMEALQVEYEQSVAGLLEERLPHFVGEPVTVYNAAIGGWDPDQYLLRARSLLADEDYDLVITAVYLGNDVIPRRREYLPPREPIERHTLRLPRAMTWGALIDSVLWPINDFLEVRSHLFLLFKNELQTLRMALGLAPLTFPDQYLRAEAESERWQVTAEILKEIDDLATGDGAKSLLALIPAPFQVDTAHLTQYVEGFDLDPGAIDLDLPNRKLGDELSSRGLTVYDALPRFRSSHARGLRLYGEVDKHFTPEGHRVFADFVAVAAGELLSEPGASDAEGGVE